MTKREACNGKPYARNPHVRFDEGEAASTATSRRGSLLYGKIIYGGRHMLLSVAACVSFLAFTAKAAWELTIEDDCSGTMTDGAVVLKVSEIDQQAKTVSVDGCANEPQNLFALVKRLDEECNKSRQFGKIIWWQREKAPCKVVAGGFQYA